MKLISVLPGRRLSPHSITDAGLAGLDVANATRQLNCAIHASHRGK
jgi:hypothetical protein